MNYRHAFHAGNFADLVKHAALLAMLRRMASAAGPLQVIDTHAGAGAYDLRGEAALKSGEAQAGIVRLLADAAAPAPFAPLAEAVRALNPAGEVWLYPGSPLLAARALRRQDRYVGCELRPDDHALLSRSLQPYPNARAQQADGYAAAPGLLDPAFATLVLIDPPFEAADDYDRIAAAVAAILQSQPQAAIAVWVPLKDLETFDALLRRLEDGGVGEILVAEARLRPLRDPMKMNGCAMLLLNPPAGIEPDLIAVVAWVAEKLGQGGALGKVWRAKA